MYDQPEQLRINRERIAVGGHSAGGNLTAAICLLARERNEFPIALQILDYPPLDLATDPNEKPTHPQAIPPWLAGKNLITCLICPACGHVHSLLVRLETFQAKR